MLIKPIWIWNFAHKKKESNESKYVYVKNLDVTFDLLTLYFANFSETAPWNQDIGPQGLRVRDNQCNCD